MDTQPFFPNSIHSDWSPVRPLVPLCLSYMAGIIHAWYFPVYLSVVLPLLLICSAAGFTTWRSEEHTSYYRILILLLAFLIGVVRMEVLLLSWSNLEARVQEYSSRKMQYIQGTVDEVKVYESDSARLILDDVTLEYQQRVVSFPGRLEVHTSAERAAEFLPGNRLQFESQVFSVNGPQVPVGMNFQIYRYAGKVFGSAAISNETVVRVRSACSWTPIRGWAYHTLNQVEQYIDMYFSDLPQMERSKISGLIGSIAFGIRSRTPVDLQNALACSGLAHITSISGLHVTLILLLVFKSLKFAGIGRKYAIRVTVLLSLLYLFMVGITVPTLRSVLMTYVFLGKWIVQRTVDALNSLALAALLILLLSPAELFLPSFQLSFSALLFLILYSPADQLIQSTIRQPVLQWLIRGLSASGIVIAGLAPFIIHYFHIFTWGAVFGNVFAVGILWFFLPLAYLWAISMLLPFDALTSIIADCTIYSAFALASITEWIAQHSFFIIPFPHRGLCHQSRCFSR
jgi:competence protein ComEC